MIFALVVLRTIKFTKPIVITTPKKPIRVPIKLLLFQNDEDEADETYYGLEKDPEAIGVNKLKQRSKEVVTNKERPIYKHLLGKKHTIKRGIDDMPNIDSFVKDRYVCPDGINKKKCTVISV
ncbi:hypothetical protein GPJ56_004286 [Histomonas meleagridis]|uniref:uncharacterized protein n=1 Tax=Histomonas meleagridis TaxID=135588 RepID=UPI003559888B|nr:hypothetical protein GPJ56_004286 [Histomonas meleagridis]KAH0800500.1 hypothetical protein GO595_006703 [Histomonas meleagridis]